ncbi:fungal-specific transcription factor domain-containing protein [Flagelloscypha sp. PMI_526]|nr:fungal-specific transcription factor domain-containing protein [Flagelloscypha sp. PMI_526]
MDSTHQAERQGKGKGSRMSRGLVACAECKRMKLKCDKKLPCGSCVRRGCSSICPAGKLVSRQESMTILTEASSARGREIQDEIAQLQERNLQLQNALALAHSRLSKEVHPLLAEAPLPKPQEDPEVDQVVEVLGTLALGGTGEVKYFGPLAGIESLYQAVSATDEPPPSQEPPLQPDLDSTLEKVFLQSHLASPLDMKTFVSTILRDLPEKMRAWSLCEIFYEHYTVYTVPIQREELIQAYLSPMYKYLEDSRADRSTPFSLATFRPHRCAATFLAFAVGAWLDLTNESYWVEADKYFQIGLSCLSMQSIFNSPEVASVQALLLLQSYDEFRGAASTATLDPSWTILSLACKVAQALGLHRDHAQWSIDKTTVERRRWLFWELFSLETLISLGTGRPPSVRKCYVDTELPYNVGRADAHGQPLQGFFRWKHETLRDVYLDVVETLLSATPPKYETIIELDRKVRSKEIPTHLNRIIDTEDGVPFWEVMQSCILGAVRSLILLTIHRNYLMKALQDPSGNPLKSRYAPSFLASYRAASWIVKCFQAIQKRFPSVLARLWHPWTNTMAAAMVLGSIAVHAPSSLVGNSPLEELRLAASMFEDAATRTVSHRTKNGAKILQKILVRAEEVHARHFAEDTNTSQSSLTIHPTNYGDDELAIFGGQKRLLPMKSRQKPLQSQQTSSSPISSSSSSSGGITDWEDVHPSLIDFLSTAPVTHVASSIIFEDLEGTLMSPLASSNLAFMNPLQTDWVQAQLPVPESYNFEKPCRTLQSELQTSENYIASTTPNYFVQETKIVDPWQDFISPAFFE